MLIGFDGSRAFIEKKTGTENYSYNLLQALAKIDRVNQYLVYTRPKTLNLKIVELMAWPENFRLVEIPWNRFWTQGGLALQTFKDKLDVLFVPAHTLPLIHPPNLKTVITVHDLGAEYLPFHHQIKQFLYLKWMTHFQLKTASKLIAVSEATKNDLVKKVGIDTKNIKVIHEGYNSQLFIPMKHEILINSLIRYKLKPEGYFLFLGTVQPRKNLDRLIEAFAKYPSAKDFRLVIVGQKGWKSDSIYQLPKELGIKNKVWFLGYVSEKDLPALYGGAIAFLFPSLFEGFGLPILEAQACGCLVLTSNLSSMPEVAGKGAVFVDPYSVDDIVKGMLEIQNLKIKNQKVKAGFENVKRFSWEKCAKETLLVLEEVGNES